MAQLAEKLHPWVAEGRPAGGPRWLQDLRERGAATFTSLGFPTVRDEEWRYTNVAPIAAAEFQPASVATVGAAAVEALPYAGATALVVVNGRFAP